MCSFFIVDLQPLLCNSKIKITFPKNKDAVRGGGVSLAQIQHSKQVFLVERKDQHPKASLWL